MAAALDFPLSPSINDIYVANGNRWQWNGSSWKRLGQLGPQGTQGTQGVQGVQGIQGIQGSNFDRDEYRFVATEGQTNFSVNYALIGSMDVFVNGVHLTTTEYTTSAGNTLILNSALVAGDIVDVVTFESAGPQGTTGVQGVQGVQGTQGIQGIQGVQGSRYWVSGVNGISTTANLGVSTTTASSIYALDVHGDARITGILTVGSSSVVIDGDNNSVHIGSGVTITQTSSYFDGGFTVAGVGTFQSDLFISGSLTAGSGGGGASIGDDIVTRNLYVNGISTFASQLSGTTASFSGDVTVGGVLKYEDVTNVDSVGIATARSGLRVTGGGLDVVGVATFNNGVDTIDVDGHTELDNVNISGIVTAFELDVDGHTELDALNVSGVATATRFDGDLNALGKTYYVATTGSDSNSGDNINEPYLTIAQALSVVTNGDIINISAGTYEETCPLTVPRGVTVKGAGLRATTIKPSDATKTNNVFELNDISTLEDFTIKDSFYNSSTDTGYAFAYATGIAITTRSPYIQRVTVLNTGSTVTTSDPYGYDTPDNPPTTYLAGRGALVDGSKVASNSLEAGMLFNEVTFFTPNNKGIILTNGARAEYLNCFHYFASQAIVGLGGTVGIAGTAETRLKFRTPGVTPSVNDVVKLYDSGGSVVAVGTITNYNTDYARISGKGYGTFTSVGIGTTQDVRFFQSDGVTQTGIASAISLADYTMFGAEMRSVGCAVEYGSQGVVADGVGVQLRLFATNFNHVGTGKDFTNDATLVVQSNEVVELNSGQVSFVSIDQSGDFRVGDSLYINQETGQVSFASTSYDLENVGNLVVTDGVSNQTLITPTSLTVGNLQLAANTFSSTTGNINIDPAASNKTIINGSLDVNGGNLTVSGISTFQDNVYLGDDDRLYFGDGDDLQIYHGGGHSFIREIGTGRLYLDGSSVHIRSNSNELAIEANQNAEVSLYYDNSKKFETATSGVNIVGTTTTGQLNVTGVSTFQGNVNLGDDDRLRFGAGQDLQIYHDSATNSSYINESGSGRLEIRGSDLYLADEDGTTMLYAANNAGVSLYYGGGKTFETTGAGVTVTGTTFSNQLGVSGISTFSQGINAEGYVAFRGDTYTASWNSSPGYFSLPDSSYVTFGSSQDLTIKHDGTNSSITNREGDLIIETTTAGEGPGGDDIVIKSRDDFEVQVAGGTTAIYATGGGSVKLNHNGSTKFETTAGGIDVTGHTELDNVNVSGVLTATSAEFSGNVTVLGDLTYENVTNQDSIGIATARAGLRVTGGGLDVVGVSTFHDNVSVAGTFGVTGLSYFQNRIEVHATGGSNRTSLSSDALTFNGSGDLTIKNNTTSGDILFTTKTSTLAKFFSGGAIELYHNNNKTLETTGVGVTITGGLDANGSINSSTDVQIDGVSVLTTASDEAIALAIALG